MKVLIAIEDEFFGRDLIGFAATQGMPADCQFCLLTAVPVAHIAMEPLHAEELQETIRGSRRKYAVHNLGKLAEQLAEIYPDAKIKSEVLDGDPKTVILEVARVWGADLILVGSHGRTGLQRLFLGSVSLAIVSQASCPVTVVRPSAAFALASSKENTAAASAVSKRAAKTAVGKEENGPSKSESGSGADSAEPVAPVKDNQIHTLRRLRLVAYVRVAEDGISVDEQKRLINEYCSEHHHQVAAWFDDEEDGPGLGLHNALQAILATDGMIVADLNKLVKRQDDRFIELRPILSRFMHEHKVVLSVKEGVETLTGYGQQVVASMIQEWSHPEPWPGLSPSQRQLT